MAVSAPGFELISDADQELLVPPSGDSIRSGSRCEQSNVDSIV